MNMTQTLTKIYTETTRNTLQYWDQHPTAGETVAPTYPKSRLGVWTGSFFEITGWATALHEALLAYSREDTRLDVVARKHLHMTFLVLDFPAYRNMAELPPEIAVLKPLFEEQVPKTPYRLRQVRLLPLKNSLVLAGIPAPEIFEARQRFTDKVLQSAWAPRLKTRYGDMPLPPPFWHITLARYEAECLPPALRELYHRYSTDIIPSIKMPHPLLAASTYDASTVIGL